MIVRVQLEFFSLFSLSLSLSFGCSLIFYWRSRRAKWKQNKTKQKKQKKKPVVMAENGGSRRTGRQWHVHVIEGKIKIKRPAGGSSEEDGRDGDEERGRRRRRRRRKYAADSTRQQAESDSAANESIKKKKKKRKRKTARHEIQSIQSGPNNAAAIGSGATRSAERCATPISATANSLSGCRPSRMAIETDNHVLLKNKKSTKSPPPKKKQTKQAKPQLASKPPIKDHWNWLP